MNTVQLSVLWCAGLLIVGILLYQGSYIHLIGAIIVLTSLGIYTLQPHLAARKRTVFLSSAAFVVLMALGWYGWHSLQNYYENRSSTLIAFEQLEFTNMKLIKLGLLDGRVRNNSKHVLTSFTLEINFFEEKERIRTSTAMVILRVPPGEVRDFSAAVDTSQSSIGTDAKDPKWRYELIATQGEILRKTGTGNFSGEK